MAKYDYKIQTLSPQYFTERAKRNALLKIVATQGQQGWRLVNTTVISAPKFGNSPGTTSHVTLFFEKEIK